MVTNTKKASLSDWKVLNEAKMELGLSEEDMKYYKVVNDPETGMIQWDAKKAEEVKEYDIPKRAFDLIEQELKEKDEKGELNADEAALADLILE